MGETPTLTFVANQIILQEQDVNVWCVTELWFHVYLLQQLALLYYNLSPVKAPLLA